MLVFCLLSIKGAIEGPVEFAEGVATGVLNLVGSTVGTTAGAISKITGVIGQSLATLTFDGEYQASRIRHREPATNAVIDIAAGGKNVVMVCFTLHKKKNKR
jgi:vacuolar protein sorting-associated protein 13A/C